MKKAATVLSCLLFALTIFFPAGVLVSGYFGCAFELINHYAFAVITAILSVCTVRFITAQDSMESKMVRVLLAIITPFSLFNALLYISACGKIGVITSVFVSAGCCCFLTVQYGKPAALKVIALVLSALMVLPVGLSSFAALIFENFGQDSVAQIVESPSGKYYAEVIVNDQGALGGNTFVYVNEKSEIDCIMFKIKKGAQNVYSGNWTSHINMEIYWKDEQCLVINAVEYAIE